MPSSASCHGKPGRRRSSGDCAFIVFRYRENDLILYAFKGSGKTLAYGLPILHHLLSQARPSNKTKRRIRALILAPTRELALQVSSHLNMCLHAAETTVKTESDDVVPPKGKTSRKEKGKQKQDGDDKADRPAAPKRPPLVSIAAIVGGMSAQKQRRILVRGVDILVATPGRLWDILEDVSAIALLMIGTELYGSDLGRRLGETNQVFEVFST
jgi:ATP-dependent RNA helicase DDX24/MAK5